jgi:hypothetical protein
MLTSVLVTDRSKVKKPEAISKVQVKSDQIRSDQIKREERRLGWNQTIDSGRVQRAG